MKTIKFVAYLFYRYYSTGATKDVSYFSTICALAMLFYMHLVQVLILLNAMDVIPTNGSQREVGNFFKMGLFMLPIFLLFFVVVKKEDILSLNYSKEKVNRGNVFLVSYIVLSFALMILLILWKKGKI